ncbi:MAG: DUF4142 domain-containing protein [Arenibacter latericius]|nr:DUF4142 domain-containing protein [Arenibacter latericius]
MKKFADYIRGLGILSLLLLAIPIHAQESPQLTDPEVASVAVVANQIDIDFAKIALKKSENKEVLDFAKRMIEDHTAVIGQAVELVTKLKVTPIDNVVSQSLLKQAEATKVKLSNTKKKDFDKFYVDNEVAYHKQVIGAVNDLLIPQSKNEELRELLATVVPALEIHLGHAEMLQQKMNSKK